MPKNITKKNYRKLHRGGWGGNTIPESTLHPPQPTKKRDKGIGKGEGKGKGKDKDKGKGKGKEGEGKPITPNLYGGGWGRPVTRSVYYDASPKMEMKKNFMNKYFKKYFN